ncbi:HAD family hydrolase [Olsenella sp. An188]|uniref:HAD family hydrolase n=1 Tax=Olsenella sp. An188 TaxID=1965579 RepID=UPI000B3778EA|nr:HAD family hydrolase [Olsenella sp. An188]OUP38741.1 haloacid dehalogenase [Olsenella sp. An188]
MIKLVLSDMDNTLVPFGARHASPRTMEAIHAVLDAGVRFGPDTGRDYVELMRFFRMDEECFMTGIFSNGKRVRADGDYVQTTLIDHDVLVRLDEVLRPEPGMFLVCYPAETNLFNPAYGVGVSSAELAVFEARTSFVGGTVDEVPDIDFVAATIACPGGPERMERCRAIVAEAVPEVRIVSPIPEWFDVLPAGTSKAAGLEVLLDALGVGLDEVAVFGDAENDLEIMRKVPHSVAVANATPEVSRAARHHVGASADEGVADALFEIARAARAGEMPAFLAD